MLMLYAAKQKFCGTKVMRISSRQPSRDLCFSEEIYTCNLKIIRYLLNR